MKEFTSNESGRYTSGSKAHNESYTEVIRDKNGVITNNNGFKEQESIDLKEAKHKEHKQDWLDRRDKKKADRLDKEYREEMKHEIKNL